MSALATLAKAVTPGSRWKGQHEVADAVWLLRVLLGAAAGVACGALGLLGLPAFLGHIVLQIYASKAWFAAQGLDPDDYVGANDQPVVMEGFAQGVAAFLLCWILAHTAALR